MKSRSACGLTVLRVVIGIIFSTVYLHFHYVVDVGAGSVLAAAATRLGLWLEPWCEPDAVMKRVALRLGMW